MSEPEDDRVLLDEIRALEDVLAADELSEVSIPKQHNLKHSVRRGHLLSRGFGEVTPFNETEVRENEEKVSIDVVQSALEANRQLLDLLNESKRELMTMLEKCIENKAIVEERIKEQAKICKRARPVIGDVGMPYFKNSMQYVAPNNEDTMKKIDNGELQVVQLRCTSPWTARDRNLLWRAIREEACASALETAALDCNDNAGCSTDQDYLMKQNFNLPKNFKAMVGPNCTREFDWMKIASMDYDDRHTSAECRVMWRVFLHPDINRYRWSNEEDNTLNALSKRFNYQDWDTIAKELGTKRSGYQCFIRYNTNNKMTSLKERAWTSSEMMRLQECVDKFSIGNYIPWGTVVKYIDGRTKNQVYLRWKYNAAPHLIKGRFTEDENKTLLEAVKLYGPNFSEISNRVMTNRSSAQLSDHYLTISQKERGIRNSWSINDDARVVKLYNKYGADWSRIAEKLPGKTRTQLRHRHKSIIRYWEKGVSLYEIPRTHDEANITNEEPKQMLIANSEHDRINTITAKYCKELQEADWELLKYFQVAPPTAKAGRKQKYYKEQELEEATKKLDILAKTLNADIQFIPEELNERTFTDKEKQLLNSLEEFQQTHIEYARLQHENIKYSRIFGKNNDEIHFTSVCSGDCNKNNKLKFNDNIDYENRKKINCQMTLDLNFETPKNVIDAIGEDKNEEFDELTKVLEMQTIDTTSAVRKIYILGPEVYTLAKVKVVTRILENKKDDNKMTKFTTRRGKRGVHWGSSVLNGIVYRGDGTIDGIEPNYHTLLGLQHIFSGEENTVNAIVERKILSDEAEASMAMFKKRLMYLFKYPIGLSRVLRPEVYIRKGPEIGCEGTEEFPVDEPTISKPAAKRRRTTKVKSTK